MLVVVSYDVSTKTAAGRRRLRKVSEACQDYGQRVQNSVFECLVEPQQWSRLRLRLLDLHEPECDSLRFYFLGRKWRRRVEHHGARAVLDLKGPLLA